MTIWEILDIEATKDKDIIKTAYRKKLISVNPEDDPQGFMALRQAFEQAMAEADLSDDAADEDSNFNSEQPIDRWMRQVDALYQSFYKRIDTQNWEQLLDDDVCLRLDIVSDTREALLKYLMRHTKLPNRIWKLFDRAFSIIDDVKELKEKFSEEYVDYIKNAITYEGVLNYDLFSGPEDADYDHYIEQYFLVKYYLDYEKYDDARKQISEIHDSDIYHPFLQVEQSRLLMYESKAGEACELLASLAKTYDNSEYILYFYGQVLMTLDRDDEAKDVFDKIITIAPEHYMAKLSLANLLLKRGAYKEAKEAYLSLLDVNEHDDVVVEQLQEANKHLIPEYEQIIRENPKDYDTILDLGWCLCQNEAYERCLEMLVNLEVDEEHRYDYINLRGRILLCLNRYKECLPFLLQWRDMILALKDDGTEKTRKRLNRIGYANYVLAMSYGTEEVADYDRAMFYIEQSIMTENNAEQLLSCYYGKADILKRQNQLEAAIEVCTDILEKEKRFYPALVLRQECFKELGYGADVLRDYHSAINLYPGGERPYELAAEVLVASGEYDLAKDLFKEADENHVDSLRLSFLQLRLVHKIAASEDDYRTVIEKLQNLLDEHSDIDHVLKSECFYLMALCCCDIYIIYGKNILEEGLKYIDEAIALTPSDDDCLNIKAYIYSKQGKTKEALKIYRQLLKKQPESCYYLFRIAAVYGDCRELEKALTYYRKVLEIDENYPDVYREIGIILREMAGEKRQRKYYRLSIEAFDKQLEKTESQYDLIERGRMYMELGMYSEAEGDFNRTLELNENNIYAYNALGDVYRYQRQYRQAITWYMKGVEHVKAENTPVLYENIAQCYECMRQYDLAGEWYEKALSMYPNRGRVFDKYAHFLDHIGNYDRAREIYERGQTLNNAYHRYFRMRIAQMMEKYAYKEALKIYRQQYKENKKDIRAAYGMGRCYLFYKHKPKKALEYYAEGLRIASEDKNIMLFRDGCLGAGLACLFSKRTKEALAYFRQALSSYEETYPDIMKSTIPVGMDANDYYMIGRLFALCGDLELAASYFAEMLDGRRCCEYCTSETCYEYLMGQALLAYFDGNKAEAIHLYKKANDIAGNDSECMIALHMLGQ